MSRNTPDAPAANKVTEAAERPKHAPKGPQMGPHGPRPAEKAINFWPSLRRLLIHLRPERPLLMVVIVLAFVGVVLNVIGPQILGHATNIIFGGIIGGEVFKRAPGLTKEQVVEGARAKGDTKFADMLASMDLTNGIDFSALADVMWLAVAVYVISFLLLWSQGWLLAGIVQRAIYRLRGQVQAKLDRLPLSYFDKQPRGEMLSRVTNDIDNVSQSLQQTLSQVLTSLLTVIGVTIMMMYTSWILGLIALLLIPAAGITTAIIGKRSQAKFVAMWKTTGELNAHIEESFTGHTLVKVFGRTRDNETAFATHNDRLFKSAFAAQAISGLMMPVMFLLGNLNYVAVAVVGGLRVANGQMSLGDVQAFIQYSRMFTQPLTQVASMANLLQSGIASAERVFQVLDADEQSPDATAELPPTRGLVRFENVDFSYTDAPLITGLNLTAEPGTTVAIVGPTGAGKTTLVNLLMRFYDVKGGAITLDGVNINDVPRPVLRDRMGMVLQDTWLFHGTIRDNIAYGYPGASAEQIIDAATAAYVDRFVHTFPDGYDTMIDEEASNLSQGQKQLITIARAFLSDPSILILDEATSSVDTRTEVLVQEAMAKLRSGRTSFVIAHRLSTIRDADVIVVMENGAIVEQGSHEELVGRDGGRYRALYEAQFAGPVEG